MLEWIWIGRKRGGFNEKVKGEGHARERGELKGYAGGVPRQPGEGGWDNLEKTS